VFALNTSGGVPSLDAEMGTLDQRAGGSGVGAQTRGVVLAFHHTQDPISGSVSPAIGRTTDGMGVICTTGHVTHAPIVLNDQGGSVMSVEHDLAGCLSAATHGNNQIVLTSEGCEASEDGTGRGTPIVANCITAREAKGWNPARDVGNGTVQNARPRRLTPKECERLMSWPDDWTRYGRKGDGTVYELSDTARYRLCGNGVGSVCVQWIAERLARAVSC
jgi:DNA (cytosine-5)-methyltransferase 1